MVLEDWASVGHRRLHASTFLLILVGGLQYWSSSESERCAGRILFILRSSPAWCCMSMAMRWCAPLRRENARYHALPDRRSCPARAHPEKRPRSCGSRWPDRL